MQSSPVVKEREREPAAKETKASEVLAKSGFLTKTIGKLKGQNEVFLSHSPRMLLNVKKNKQPCPVPEIQDINVNRVTFNTDTYSGHLPQQIPTKNPRPGCIKILDNGNLIRPYSMNDIVNPEKGYRTAVEAATLAAYTNATAVAKAAKEPPSKMHGFLSSKSSNDATKQGSIEAGEPNTDCGAVTSGKLQIDTPMHGSTGFPTPRKPSNPEAAAEAATPAAQPTGPKHTGLAELYAKCCHLREIMPIQATMAQIEGHETALPSLQLTNHRPTLIDVLSFADFIAIAPISTIILYNFDGTEEMFRNIVLAVARSTTLRKLCLSGANLTPNNLKVLCAFLLASKSIRKLDISIVRDSEGNMPVNFKQMPFFPREQLDWRLFTKTLVARGGIEELLINGCMIPHDAFQELISQGCSIATKRLGVASSDLQEDDFRTLCAWAAQTNCVCEGIDVGGNDLSKCNKLLTLLFEEASIQYMSLNSCKLSDAHALSQVMDHRFGDSKLRFIDLSYNPALFPDILPAFDEHLPKFGNLRRLHLDYNNLGSAEITQLADTIVKCPKLYHLSLLGNRDINDSALEALAMAVKLSKTLTVLELDTDIVPANIARRISHYCLQNMEELIDPEHRKRSEEFDKDESELIDDGTSLAKAVGYALDTSKEQHKTHLESVTVGLADRATAVRVNVRDRIEQLISSLSDNSGTLDPQLREKLVRLYALDSTLERALRRYGKVQEKLKHPLAPYTRTSNAMYDVERAEALLGVAPHRSFSRPQMGPVAPSYEDVVSGSVESEVHMLQDNSRASPEALKELRRQAREEGDIHKLRFFTRQHSLPEIQTSSPSGKLVRKLLLSASGSRPGSIHESEGVTSASQASTPGTPGTPDPTGQQPADIDAFINNLKQMSDAEIQAYFRTAYGQLPATAQAESDNTSLSDDNDDDDDDGTSSSSTTSHSMLASEQG